MLQFAHYAEPTFHAIGSLDNFYAKQHPDGYICREIVRKTGEDFMLGGQDNTTNPPLFSWVEWQNYLLMGDKSRFRDVLPRLVKYYGWIKEHRRHPNGLYWNTGLGSGEDDLVRSDSAYSWGRHVVAAGPERPLHLPDRKGDRREGDRGLFRGRVDRSFKARQFSDVGLKVGVLLRPEEGRIDHWNQDRVGVLAAACARRAK